MRRVVKLIAFVIVAGALQAGASDDLNAQSVARQWNEALLNAIRMDFPAPTVHSRNLYHTSAAMYDAWATFDDVAAGQFYAPKETAANVAAARDEAISYAAYRVLSTRYQLAVDPAASQAIFDGVMGSLGYDPAVTTTVGTTPAAIGNRIADLILTQSLNDAPTKRTTTKTQPVTFL